MVNAIVDALEHFSGEANHIQCFAHTVNFVMKTVLHQFEVDSGKTTEVLNATEWALCKLTQGLNLEEQTTVEEKQIEGEMDDLDDLDRWRDETKLLTDKKREKLKSNVLLVKQALIKVH